MRFEIQCLLIMLLAGLLLVLVGPWAVMGINHYVHWVECHDNMEIRRPKDCRP